MKHFAFVVLATCLVLACTSAPSGPAPRFPVSELDRATVALVHLSPMGSSVFCGAVWVAPDKLLTAAHCVRDEDSAIAYEQIDGSSGIAMIVRADEDADLALLADPLAPHHATADIAPFSPVPGDEVDIVGHPAGNTWSLSHGWVSGYPERDGERMQVSAPVFFGNSGGGAFNSQGQLVGIAHTLAVGRLHNTPTLVPSLAFFVDLKDIRAFLEVK